MRIACFPQFYRILFSGCGLVNRLGCVTLKHSGVRTPKLLLNDDVPHSTPTLAIPRISCELCAIVFAIVSLVVTEMTTDAFDLRTA